MLLLGAITIKNSEAVKLPKLADLEKQLAQQNSSIEDKAKLGQELKSFIQANAEPSTEDIAKVAQLMKAVTLWDHLKVASVVGDVNPALTYMADPAFNRLVNQIKSRNENYTNYPIYRPTGWSAEN